MFDIATYLNRITSQHKIKPKYMALVAARLQPFIDLVECLESFDAAFDLDTAVGKQLDTIGEYVGVKRLLNFQPQFAPALLPDEYYRMLIKARISLNNWDGTVTGIENLWGDIFPGYTITVVDNQNMTLNVQIVGLQSLFESELVKHGYITPKPMGVLVDYYVLFSIFLDTELYLGSFIFDRFLDKGLPAPAPPVNNSKPPGEVYIGGLAAQNIVESIAAFKPPPDATDVDNADLYAEGVKTSDRIMFGVADKPPPTAVTVELEQLFAAGLKTENIVGRAAQDKPPSDEIEPPITDDYTHAGLFSSRSVVASIAGKPNVGAFDTLRAAAFEGGIRAAATLRYVLPSASTSK